jgi:hypothetical protein
MFRGITIVNCKNRIKHKYIAWENFYNVRAVTRVFTTVLEKVNLREISPVMCRPDLTGGKPEISSGCALEYPQHWGRYVEKYYLYSWFT